MRKTSLKAVIFDIDDTLISEYDYVLSGYRAVAEKLASDGDTGLGSEEIYNELKDLSKESFLRIYNRLFKKLGLEEKEDRIKELVYIYQNHDPDIRLYDDVDKTLTELKKRGCALGVISDGEPQRQRRKLKVCDAERYFDFVIITDELGGVEYRKPDDRSYRLMSSRLGTAFEDMIYVGDNPSKDFCVKKIIPIRTARIIRPHGIYADREYMDGIKEDYRLESLYDITEYI